MFISILKSFCLVYSIILLWKQNLFYVISCAKIFQMTKALRSSYHQYNGYIWNKGTKWKRIESVWSSDRWSPRLLPTLCLELNGLVSVMDERKSLYCYNQVPMNANQVIKINQCIFSASYDFLENQATIFVNFTFCLLFYLSFQYFFFLLTILYFVCFI